MKRLVAIGLVIFLIAPVLLVAELRREIRAERREMEQAVADTVHNIRVLETGNALTAQTAKGAAVIPANVQILSENPTQFRVEAHTSWPDWMIYEYDSRQAGRGVRHYLF